MEKMVSIPNSHFWCDRKVFLTGHTGFKGTWLSLWLAELGAELTGLSLPVTADNTFFENTEIAKEISHIESDILDYNSLLHALKACNPSVIFHFAAQSLVSKGYEDPLKTWNTNVQGTANLLQAVHEADLQNCTILVATTDKVYLNLEANIRFVETDMIGGHDPYSASKAATEILLSSWSKSFDKIMSERNCTLLSLRAGNVIGGGDWSENRILPDLARAFYEGRTLNIRQPESVRPWQYVLDVLNAYLLLAEGGSDGRIETASAWNIGPPEGESHSVKSLVEEARKKWPGEVNYAAESDFQEAKVLRLNISKLVSHLSWRPVLSFEQSVEETVNWYREALRGGCLKKLSLQHLRGYLDGARNG
ncbi:MAG: CDP-glucose 4,6-dehydratase [Parvibaculales bacterium]